MKRRLGRWIEAGTAKNGSDSPLRPFPSITPLQLAAITATSIVGVGVLALPRLVVEMAYTGATLATLIGSLIGVATGMLAAALSSRFPGQTLVRYARRTTGRLVGTAVGIAYAGIALVSAALVAREFGEVTISAVLLETPLEITVLVMISVAVVMARYDVQVVGRVYEFTLPIVVFPAVIIAFLSLRNAHFIHLLPLAGGGWDGIASASLLAASALLGFMVSLVFVSRLDVMRLAVPAVGAGVGLAALIHLQVVVAALSVFGPEQAIRRIWPTLELARITTVPGNLLERLDAPFIGIWVLANFTTIAGLLYAGVWALTDLLRLEDHRTVIPFVVPGLYLIAMFVPNVHALYELLKVMAPSFFLTLGGAIAVLLAIDVVRRGRRVPVHGAEPRGEV